MPGIKRGNPGDRAVLVGTEEGCCIDRVGRLGLRGYVRPVPWIWGRSPKGKKVCRKVPRDNDGGLGEILPFQGQEKANDLVKETEKEQRGDGKARMPGVEKVANGWMIQRKQRERAVPPRRPRET